jgi:hypothetical protein
VRMSLGRRQDETVQPDADELTAELAASYWQAHDRRLAETGFGAVARQLPGLIGQAIRLGWEANRRDTVATIGLNLISGVLTGFALLATTGVLEALFAAARRRSGSGPRCPHSSWSRWPWRPGPACRPRRAGPSRGSIRRWTGWWRSGYWT